MTDDDHAALICAVARLMQARSVEPNPFYIFEAATWIDRNPDAARRLLASLRILEEPVRRHPMDMKVPSWFLIVVRPWAFCTRCAARVRDWWMR